MDSKKYDRLRAKINGKNFENTNKGFDLWLYSASYLGNIASIFFSYFLIYPSLHKAISINLTSGSLGVILSAISTVVFLAIFEIIKRYLVKNFSFQFISNRNKIKASIFGWSIALVSIIFLSFYLSLSGSRNLASTSKVINDSIVVNVTHVEDSLINIYNVERKSINNKLDTLENRQNRYEYKKGAVSSSESREFKTYTTTIKSIKNDIKELKIERDRLDSTHEKELQNLSVDLSKSQSTNKAEDSQIIILFIVIAICGEMIIFIGIYFREYFEYNLFILNQQKFETIILKKDRYSSLLRYIYEDGKVPIGSKVMGELGLKEIVTDRTKIPNPGKFLKEFLSDMDKTGIFTVTGKKRYITLTLGEALIIVENLDETTQILENIK